MELEQITNLIMNTGVTVFVVIYFAYRDNKFLTSLNTTLTTLVDTVQALKDELQKKNEKIGE